MTYIRLLLCLSFITLYSTATAENDSIRPYFNSETFLYSEPVSLKTIKNDWQGKYYTGGEKQIGKFQTEVGVINGKWSIAGIYREDYYINFTTDTADLYHGVENNQSIDRTTAYKLSLDAYRFRGKGLQVKRTFEFTPKLNGKIGVNLFKASNLLDGKLKGQAEATSSDNYSFNIEVNSQYSEDPLFDRNLENTLSGTGLAIDIDLFWQTTPEISVSLVAKDIAGFIRWNDVPHTSANANSNNVLVNETGFTEVNPILNGTEDFKSHYTQSLKPSFKGKVSYDFKQSPYKVNLNLKHFEGLDLFGVGLNKSSKFGETSFNYWPSINTAEFNLKHKRVGFTLGLDNLNLKNTRTAWLSLSYGI